MITQEELDNKWHRKIVRVTTDHFKTTDGSSMKGWIGEVTAALASKSPNLSGIEDNDAIFAVMFEGYELGKTPERWITFHFSPEMVELENFEVIL